MTWALITFDTQKFQRLRKPEFCKRSRLLVIQHGVHYHRCWKIHYACSWAERKTLPLRTFVWRQFYFQNQSCLVACSYMLPTGWGRGKEIIPFFFQSQKPVVTSSYGKATHDEWHMPTSAVGTGDVFSSERFQMLPEIVLHCMKNILT